VLPAALAIFLVAAVVQAVSGFGFALVATPLLAMVAGPQHAVLTTSTGTNGPPLVAAVQGMGVAPRVFRATMAALLAGAGFVGIASLAASGAVGSFDVSLAAAGLPVALLGGWAGRRIVARVNPLRFRQIVLSALVASSAVALVHATF
jgi:hypothetical protein